MDLRTILAAAALLASAPLPAHSWSRTAGVEVSVVADDGRPFARYAVASPGAPRDRRAYLQARMGARYAIRVYNPGPDRVGLVLAVDGRNIISGSRSELGPTEPMYVLGPYQTATYRGWRSSETEVRRFFFTRASASYAETFGDRSAMGVIAVAAYRERVPDPPPLRLRSEAAPAAPADPAREGASSAFDAGSAGRKAGEAPGTGFGEGRRSPVVRVSFQPEAEAWSRDFLKYEWRETLVRLGIVPAANRFWPRAGGEGFAPFPGTVR